MSSLEQRIIEIESLKKQLGFKSNVVFPPEGKAHVDLDRLALLIDPTTTTRLYSQKKFIGPLLTFLRTGFVKFLHYVFRLDFSRVIELHQNVWLMAYQMQEMQKRIDHLEQELKNKHG